MSLTSTGSVNLAVNIQDTFDLWPCKTIKSIFYVVTYPGPAPIPNPAVGALKVIEAYSTFCIPNISLSAPTHSRLSSSRFRLLNRKRNKLKWLNALQLGDGWNNLLTETITLWAWYSKGIRTKNYMDRPAVLTELLLINHPLGVRRTQISSLMYSICFNPSTTQSRGQFKPF